MANEKRLIDAIALLSIIEKEMRYGRTDILVSMLGAVADLIRGVPTVNAKEVVHGEWVGIQYDGYADGCPVYDLWECSNCREEYESEGDPPPYNYCPNCGAKMDGEEKENNLLFADMEEIIDA